MAVRRAASSILLALLLLWLAPTARADDAPRSLLLDVVLNDRPLDMVVEVIQRGRALFIQQADLRALGLMVPPDAPEPVPLAKLPGVAFHVDDKKQRLLLAATDAALEPHWLGDARDKPIRAAHSGFGGVLNYDIVGNHFSTGNSGSGLFDGRVFSDYGVFSQGLLAQGGSGFSTTTGQPGTEFNRLSSTWHSTDEDTMRSWSLGDVISNGSLSWTRPFRLGGAQFGSDFTLRPDLITFPVPAVAGRTTLPSTVDVFVNNVRQLSQRVDPGPFSLRQAPVVTGAGNVTVVVRDAQGAESVQRLDFYASPRLLKSGLDAYSFEAGYLRKNYGLDGDSYTKPVGAGSYRRGLAQWLTLESHLEFSRDVQMAGAGAALCVANWLLLTPSAAASTGGGFGQQYGIGAEHIDRYFSITGSILHASRDYRDVAATSGDPVPRQTVRGGVGVSLGPAGTVQVAYADIRGGLLLPTTNQYNQLQPTTVGNARVVSASWTRSFGALSVYATAYTDLNTHDSIGAVIGFSIPLGGRASATTSADFSNRHWGNTTQVNQGATNPGEIGWQGYVSNEPGANLTREMGQADYITPVADVWAGVDRVNGVINTRAGARGSVVATPQGVFAANSIGDSFAVVDTNGVGGVGVLQENRPVGKTDSKGMLLVPGLNSYQANRLALDSKDIPPDVDTGALTKTVRPRDRSGVVVDFGLQRSGNAIVHLVDENGADLPIGAQAVLGEDGKPVPVGYEGEVFLTGLSGKKQSLTVTTQAGICHAAFDFKPKPGEIPQINNVVCAKPVSL